ncbi:MAG: cytochrome [Burkholderiales bacterium 66-5]|uniref:cytochrome P450 n=1 Tax=Comamonas badia TaxID=265291 RepID=UPI0003F86A0F|nr:cytochrome P450 [Comamonas badia]OJU86515.1 MAG: cytochrome [Burkholderiales bacterium 66-5]
MNENSGIPVLDVDPYSAENLTDPYPMHALMRSAGPVVRLKDYPTVVACARHQETHAVFNDAQTFISGAGVGLANFNIEKPFRPRSLILEADAPLHTATRAVLSRIMSPKTVMQIRASFAQEAERLLDKALELNAANGSIDWMAVVANPFPLKVFADSIGIQEEGRENLLLYGDMVFNSMGPQNEVFTKSVERVVPVTQWIMDQCDRSKLRPGGFGDLIWQAAEAGEISMEQAPMLVRSLLSAGLDTTINSLGNAIYALGHHPQEYARLHSDPSLARPAFEEALRWESTVQTFFRTANRDCEIAGVPIAAQTKVLCMLASANRDPDKWPDADTYDIGRRPSGHMAFGSGLHGCVGQAIARLEGELILTALAKRVKGIEFAGPHTRRLNNTLRAFDTLPVRLIPA